MPPKRCPRHLERLIADDPQIVREIRHALQDWRQNKGAETLGLKRTSRVTINLTDLTVTVLSDLKLALADTDAQSMIDLIHECPVCDALFWTGRIDKVACNKHAKQWRKSRQRLREREGRAKAEREALERKIRKELQRMSHTAVAVLDAIVLRKQYLFWKIDNDVADHLDENPLVRRVPSTYIVRQTLTMLVERGYLTHEQNEQDERKDRYFAENKLLRRWPLTPTDDK